MNAPRLITWSCPVEGCRKTHFTPIPPSGMATLLCGQCGYTAVVRFEAAPAAERVPDDPNHSDFQPF